MKIKQLAIAALVIGTLAACKKDTEPVIVINGDNPASVNLNDTYTDEGATASDNNGSVTITTAGLEDVNTAEAGSYTVVYRAANDVASVQATRTVNVILNQSVWTGNFNVTHDCDTQVPLNATPDITAGATESDLVLNNVLTLVGGTLNATISGNTITIPQQDIDITVGVITLSGTGTMNATGDEMTITYDYTNSTPVIGGSGTCTATYTK